MEILTKSAQDTHNLGEKIADLLIKFDSKGVILGRSEATTPESAFHSLTRADSGSRLDRGFSTKSEQARMTKRKHALVLALYGELGSGKTTFVQGFAKGIGIPHRLVSPTFIIIREYPLNLKNFRRFYHIDLYRIEARKEAESLGFAEIISDPANIVVIEWAERLGKLLPGKRIDITFATKSVTERLVTIDKRI